MKEGEESIGEVEVNRGLQEKRERNQRILELVESMENEIFPFPGIKKEAYARMKADDEEYPGYTTPTDEVIKRLKSEGIKVVLSTTDRLSGNVFILPTTSDNIEMDGCIPLKNFQIVDGMDERLRELIELKTKT